MNEETIITKRIPYGRVQVTLPMPVKTSMLVWVRKSGMGKAEFLRVALMMGARQLAEGLNAKEPGEGYYSKEEEKQSECITGGAA
jgi:hypothetical protein